MKPFLQTPCQVTEPCDAISFIRFAADSDAAARRLFTSLQQSFLNLHRGTPGPLPPPIDSMDGRWSLAEQAGVTHTFREAVVGGPATVLRGLEAFLARTRVDELMITAMIHDPAARVNSFSRVAEIRDAKERDAAVQDTAL